MEFSVLADQFVEVFWRGWRDFCRDFQYAANGKALRKKTGLQLPVV